MMSLRFVPQQQQPMSKQRPRKQSIPSQVPIQPQQQHHSSPSSYYSSKITFSNNNSYISNNAPLTPITPSSSSIHSVKVDFSYQPSSSPFILAEQQSQSRQPHTGIQHLQNDLPGAPIKATTSPVVVTSNVVCSTFGTLSSVISASNTSSVLLPSQLASLVQPSHNQYNSIDLLQNRNIQPPAVNHRQQFTSSPPLSVLPASVQSATLNINESTAETSVLFHSFITAIMDGKLKPAFMDGK
jgi:hypothetical protein